MKIDETKPIQLARRRFLTGAAALLSASYLPSAWPKALPPKLPIPALVDGILLLTLWKHEHCANVASVSAFKRIRKVPFSA